MKNIRTFLFLAAAYLCSAIPVTAQPFLKVKKVDFYKEDAGFKEAWDRIKEGDKYFQEGQGSYSLALEQYLKAKDYNGYNPQLNYKIGVTYLYSDKKWEAQKYLDLAYEFNPHVTPDIQFFRGRAYQYNCQFEKAISLYNAYRDSLPEKALQKQEPLLKKYISECEAGVTLIQDTLRVKIENAGSAVNSLDDDYNPVISCSSARMFFTSRRSPEKHSRINAGDNKYTEDVYVAYQENGNWFKAEPVGNPINTPGNEAALYLSKDDKFLFLYYGKEKNGNLYVSEFRKGRWLDPSPMPGKFNSKSKETTVSFMADMSEMYFVTRNEKESIGGSDIFFSKLDAKNHYSKPVNLGKPINTEYDEEAVHVTPGGDTLYFSSKGHNTMGGFDVFMSVRTNGQWSEPVNMGFPINSPDNDLFYSNTKDTALAYFSSIRKEGLGWMDIFKVTFLPPPPPIVIPEPLPEPPKPDTVVKVVRDTVRIVEPPVVPVDVSLTLIGSIMEEGTSNPVMAKIELIDMDKNQVIATTISEPAGGSYRIKIQDRKNYGVEITAQGYMVYLDIVEIPTDVGTKELLKNFFLKKVKVGEKVVLKNIFFDTNKATLKPESYAELNNVFKLLTTNPTLRIEISGHTDNVGSAQANTTLSQARAKAVVDYLVANGIDPARLEYRGYGFTQPIAPNDTPQGRAQNRRVEFKILSK